MAIFGLQAATTGMQSAEVKNTTNRTWIRLVGRRHDVQLWVPDTRPQGSLQSSAFTNRYKGKMPAGKEWATELFESFRARHFVGVEKWWLRVLPKEMPFVVAVCLFSPLAAAMKRLDDIDEKERTSRDRDELSRLRKESAGQRPMLKEVVLYPPPGSAVHVFNATEHGRRYYRSLVYTSDASFSFHDFTAHLVYTGAAARPVARVLIGC